MRIGFDAKRAFNNRTGLGNYSRFVLNALHNYAPQYEYLAYTPKIKTGLFDEFSEKSIRMPNSTNPLYGAWWRSYGIKKDLSQEGVQIYHGLSNELPNGLQKAGVRSVVTIHDLIFLRYPELYPVIDRFFYRQKFKSACAEADVIVAVSEQTKRDIVAFYGTSPEKIQVVYQDCHEAFHAPQTSQVVKTREVSSLFQKYNIGKPYILSVGTIEARKNQLHLVKAFHAAHLEGVELVLVGGQTSYQRELEAYIAQHRLTAKVKILNSVPFADLPSLYRSARVFAYPSFFEGFGIPIVEALHSGVPVVAATGSCLEEAGGKGGLYVDPKDVDAFAQTLTALWHDETLRKTLIQEGQKHVQLFAAAKIAQELTEIYASL